MATVVYLADTLAVMQSGEMVESLNCVDLNQLTHPYSQQLLAAQLPTHPCDRKSFPAITLDQETVV